MNIFIDLEQQLVISDFTNRNPISAISVKGQDTPLFAVYFVQRGINYNLGASPGLRFGLFTPGNPNPLVQCTSFVSGTDQNNRIVYRGYPNFNTSAMAAAIAAAGSSGIASCLGEFRYQTSGGTIARTQDVTFAVQRVLLSETIIDNTTAAFTTPAVGSTVPIAQSSTAWLTPGLILSIGAGAGSYTVSSITDATHFVAQNDGGTGNAAPGTVIPTGTTVGIAPANVLSTYPDPSVIEITPHKGAVNGYAGLDANRLVLATAVPIDGQSIVVSGGKIAANSVITSVATTFTTPAANATVSVNVASTSSLHVGQYVRIPIAGYYIVETITDGTHVVLQNNGDPYNASSGTTITVGAVLLPAQAASGSGTGTPGQNAFTLITASFIVPAVGSTVSVAMGATSWLGGSGYVVFIQNAGYYAVSSVTDSTHAVLTNLGYAATNASVGTTIASGSQVSPGGLQGTASTVSGANAYDTTAASFTMPAGAASVAVTIGNTAWLGVNQVVYIAGAGYFTVASISSPTIFNATNANYPGATTPGNTIASGARVSPGGPIGPQGAGGPGLNAFTTLSSNFTQPVIGSTATIVVGTTAWMAPTQGIYIQGGGYYTISSIGDLTHVTVNNVGAAGNLASGSTVTGSGTQLVSPSGIPGTSGINAYALTTANFVTPAAGASVSVLVTTAAWATTGQVLFVAGAGYYQVAAILSPTQFSLTNLAGYGNTAGGTTINSGASISASGVIGPAGPAGSQGPAGRDGAYSTIYTGDSIQGTGGAASPAILVADVAQGTNPYYVYQRNSSGNSLWAAALLSAADAVSSPGSGEISHIQSQTSGVLALKKLKSGTTGSVALTDQGGSTGDILVDVPVDGTTIQVSGGHLVAVGGGGGGTFDPKNGLYFYDDFGYGSNNVSQNYVLNTNGTGAGATYNGSTYGQDTTHKVSGLVELATGTTSTTNVGASLVWGWYNTSGSGPIIYGLGALVWKARVFVESALPPTGITYQFKAGIANSASTNFIASTGQANAFYFHYAPDTNSGQWIVYVNLGSLVAYNTTVAVAADTAYDLEIDLNAAWTSLTAYINGTLVATVTTGIPTGTGCPFFTNQRGASTTNYKAAIDSWMLNYTFTR